MTYILYTDGGCRGNPGKGGWGYHLITNENKIIEDCGFEKYTTNNKMEMAAVLEGCSRIPYSSTVTIYTDSTYVKNGITKWILNWKQNNWQTSAKKPVKNQKYWVALDDLNKHYNITWKWVKGHANIYGNERADALANQAMDQNSSNTLINSLS